MIPACPVYQLTDVEWSSPSHVSVLADSATLTGLVSERQVRVSDETTRLTIGLAVPPPTWFKGVLDRLEHLLSLPANWDSFGAQAVEVRKVAHALRFLSEVMTDETPSPEIVPTPDGGLQFEWHKGRIDLEVEVVSATRIMAGFEDLETGEVWEREVSQNLRPVVDALRFLKMREAAG